MTESAATLPAPLVDRETLVHQVRAAAHHLTEGDLRGYDSLIDLVGDTSIVLIGDASHGTHEFYRERALITTRLIEEKGFNMIAVEADWPEGQQVNQYVQGGPGKARQALEVFSSYPTWMWGNLDFLHFVDWLRRYNDARPSDAGKVGFHGIDVRNLDGAGKMVVKYLREAHPDMAGAAAERLARFEHFTAGLRNAYQHREDMGITDSCEQDAIALLDMVRGIGDQMTDGTGDDRYFCALQAATVIYNGERFYQAVYRKDRPGSWNVRDTHMMDTLDALLAHTPGTRAVVWEHNTHIGDFRATENPNNMVNIGQLVRERRPGQSIAVGFGTYTGTVTATAEWGQQPQHMHVPAAPPETYDGVFHDVGLDRFLLLLAPLKESGRARGLDDWRGQRAIGVVYNPQDESENYVPTKLVDRYDAYVHIDRSTAIHPLREEPTWQSPLPMDAYPPGY